MHRVAPATVASAALAFALLADAKAPALADSWNADGVVAITAGITDNALPATRDEDGEAARAEADRATDAFVQLAPGLVLARIGPRAMHVVTYDLELTAHADTDGANTLSNRVRWIGSLLTSPLTRLTVRAAAAHGKINVFSGSAPADAATADAVPGGARDFASADAAATLRWRWARPWAVYPTGFARALGTFADWDTRTRVVEAGGGVGVERLWRHTACALDTRSSVAELRDLTVSDGIPVDRRHVLGQATLTLRRDLGRRFTTRVGAGAGMASADVTAVRPVAHASLGYSSNERARVDLTAERTLAADLYLAQSVDTRAASVRGSAPLPFARSPATGRGPFAFTAAVGVRHSRALDLDDGRESTPWTTYVADAALAWRARPNMLLSLRYQFARQVGDPMLEGGFAPFTRNVVLVTVSGRYPGGSTAGAVAAETGRVDGADQLLDLERER